MTINIKELQDIITQLTTIFAKKNGNDIKIENDYYWNLSSEEIYDLTKEPIDFSLGQLTDDWETLKRATQSDTLVPYDLQRVSKILRALSEENPI